MIRPVFRRAFGLLCLAAGAVAFLSPAMATEGNRLTPALTSRVPETPIPGPAHSIGSAANGCLVGAVALPLSGRGWETLRP